MKLNPCCENSIQVLADNGYFTPDMDDCETISNAEWFNNPYGRDGYFGIIRSLMLAGF